MTWKKAKNFPRFVDKRLLMRAHEAFGTLIAVTRHEDCMSNKKGF